MQIPEAERLAELLVRRHHRIVLAESCTAGLAASLLGVIPGISNHLCGSWVTYRDECKHDWLGVPQELIDRFTSVSEQVTESMATLSLLRSPTAHASAAITGHLGPDAPPNMDGVCFIAVATRSWSSCEVILERRIELATCQRVDRQLEAASALLGLVADVL